MPNQVGIPESPEDKEVTYYLITRKKRNNLLRFIAEYLDFEKIPDWVVKSQDDGEIPVILHGRLLLEFLANDITDY